MGFQHPQQRPHMLRGIAAAAKSPRTPAHLKPHLARMAAMQPQPMTFSTQVASKENKRDVMPRPTGKKKKGGKKRSPMTLQTAQNSAFYGG